MYPQSAGYNLKDLYQAVGNIAVYTESETIIIHRIRFCWGVTKEKYAMAISHDNVGQNMAVLFDPGSRFSFNYFDENI